MNIVKIIILIIKDLLRAFQKNSFYRPHPITLILFSMISMTIIMGINPNNVYSHRIMAFASFDGGKIDIDGYFSNGNKIKGANVIIKDNDGVIVAKGATNKDGKFSFIPQKSGNYDIIVDAHGGHIARTNISIQLEESGSSLTAIKKTPNNDNGIEDKNINELNKDDKTILRELRGIRQEVHALRIEYEKVKLRDIIGGIGYLFGIFGVITIVKKIRR